MSEQPKRPGGITLPGEPKEKQADAPAASENDQKRQREAKKAVGPDGHLLPELQREQAGAEPAPPRVPLVVPRKDEMGNPADHPPHAPPPAAAGPAPRTVHENERAPAGLARFRVRCENYGQQEARYVLAASEREARDHYLRSLKIDRLAEALGDGAPDPMLSVVRLPD